MIKGENLTTEKLNELRPKGIAFTGTVEISATLLLENGDKKKIEKYWKETLNKRNTLEFPTEFTYDYKFIFDLHTYKETKRTCTFLTKTKNKINFKEIKLDPEYTDGKLYLSFKIRTESKKEFLVKERSKGFKWFFSFLLFTEFRKKRTSNILFLLDEPASNLHSSAQAKILDALSELSTDSLVIYSTHSHHLINPKWLVCAYICINENLSSDVLAGSLN